MDHNLFSEVSNPTVRVGSRKWYTIPLSIASHAVAIAVLVIIPLTAADILPSPPTVIAFVETVAPPPPPPPPPPETRIRQRPQTTTASDAPPVNAPQGITPEPGLEPDPAALDTLVEPAVVSGVEGGLWVAPAETPVPPLPPTGPVRVGGQIKEPRKTRNVLPVYPQIAQAARVSGTVVIEATIGIDGTVTDARIVRSVPLLDQAALDAVRQWQFTPTLLNGVAVPVVMNVMVRFTLQ
jgi:protein TonB